MYNVARRLRWPSPPMSRAMRTSRAVRLRVCGALAMRVAHVWSAYVCVTRRRQSAMRAPHVWYFSHALLTTRMYALLVRKTALILAACTHFPFSLDLPCLRSAAPPATMALFVFAGQSCSAEVHGDDMRVLAERVCESAREQGVELLSARVCYAPEHTSRKWAVYCPTDEEVASFGGDWWAAERATRSVPALGRDLAASASDVWESMGQAYELYGSLLICGCSNGCVLATEYATSHPERIRALILLSGLPSLTQQGRVDSGQKVVPPTCLTVGTWEKYFGGRPSFESVAKTFGCPLVEFAGGHCREDAETIALATRLALEAKAPQQDA